MDLLQMAGHLSLEFDAVVEGVFTSGSFNAVVLWLPNKRGIGLTHLEGRDADGTAELAVIRETVPVRDVEYQGTPWRFDYSTPVTIDVKPGMDLDGARAALRILRELPGIDPRDQRDTRKLRPKGFVHYGRNRTVCGDLGPDDVATETIREIRCLPCMVEVHRTV